MPVGASIAAATAVGVAGSVAGAAISANAAEDAANTQANAAKRGQDLLQAQFDKTQTNLLPYMQFGQQGLNILQGNGPASLNGLTQKFNPTMADLAATPGYQFTLQQGEQSVANALSAQGQANNNTPGTFSGPAAKGAINYAEGLASTTYNQQFQNYLQQNSQLYNMLMGVVGGGQNAAAGLGGFGAQSATQQANLLTSGAAAQAAGTVGAANAIGGGLSGASSAGANGLLLNALLNQQKTGQTTIGPTDNANATSLMESQP